MLKYITLSEINNNLQPSLQSSDTFEELPNTNPLVVVDMSETILYSNRAFNNLFGEIKDSKITNLKAEPDLRYLLRTFAQSQYTGIECELDLVNNQGKSSGNYTVSIERIFLRSVEYLILTFKVVDEKKIWESRINSINLALDYGKIPIIITDTEGKITYVTPSFDKILNIPVEAIFNNYLHYVLSPHLNEQDKKSLINALGLKKEWNSVITNIQADGSMSFFELKLIPLHNYSDSSSYILSGNDITAYITKTQLLKKNETKLKSIINNISDLLLLVKFKKGIYYFEDANENFCRTFTIDKRKINSNIADLPNNNFTSTLIKEIDEGHNDKPGLKEFKYSENGRQYLVKISFVINSIEDEIIYIVSLNDITDEQLIQDRFKQAYEKENHYNRLKSAILKNMSHEIRTPLNALIGYSEIIEEGLALKDYNVLSEVSHSLKDILNRILNLFSNIVEVSHIETNELEFDFCQLNVNKILKSVYNKKYTEARNKNLEFRLDLSEEETLIKIDWVKMEKVIFALVDNAIKYTYSGRVLLRSEIINDYVLISVVDTGIGMNREKIKNFVEAFIQGEEGYTKYFEGAGLGLTLAYHYVEKMGGNFSIESELNTGTAVQIRFPLCSAGETCEE
jgi:PAS domain S-box-containing protein